MNKSFYFWLCFGVSAVAIVGVWLTVITKTIRHSLSSANITDGFQQDNRFKEIELKFKGLQNINKLFLEQRAAEAQEKQTQKITAEKLMGKLNNSSSTTAKAPPNNSR